MYYHQDFDSSIFDMIIKIRPQNLFSVKQADGTISAKRTRKKGAIHKRRQTILGGEGGLKFRCCKTFEGRS